MGATVEAVVSHLERAGWARDDARRGLRELGWEALLPAVAGDLTPEAVADDLRRHTRCQICGHPLHQVVGDVDLRIAGVGRMARHLPHTAACSCGYARPLVPEVWAAVVGAYFRRHPEANEVDVAAPGFWTEAEGGTTR